MRPLIIGLKEQAEIKKIKEEAAKTPVTRERLNRLKVVVPTRNLALKDITEEQRKEENLAQHKLILPVGFRVAYSVEEQPAGLCGHLSISVDTKGKAPNLHAVQMIAEAFELKVIDMWTEEFEPKWIAVNVLGFLT